MLIFYDFMLKRVLLLNILVETIILFQESSKEQFFIKTEEVYMSLRSLLKNKY